MNLGRRARPRLRVPSGQRQRIITGDDAPSLLAELRRPRRKNERERTHALRLDAADLSQIVLQTAARRMEIMLLRWSDVNSEWKTLRTVGKKTQHKGDHVRVISMADTLLALFKRRRVNTVGHDQQFDESDFRMGRLCLWKITRLPVMPLVTL